MQAWLFGRHYYKTDQSSATLTSLTLTTPPIGNWTYSVATINKILKSASMNKSGVAQAFAAAADLTITELESLTLHLNTLKNSKSPLFRLPAELRNRIWRTALIEDIQDQVADTGHLRAKEKHDCMFWTDIFGPFEVSIPITPPPFLNACRQLKLEVEPMLFRDIMVFEEYDVVLKQWKTLEPYHLGSLFNTRKLGLPVFAMFHLCKATKYNTRQVIEVDTKSRLVSTRSPERRFPRAAKQVPPVRTITSNNPFLTRLTRLQNKMATELALDKLESPSPLSTQLENSLSPLLRLPSELRNEIWRMALIKDIEEQVATPTGGKLGHILGHQAPSPNTCSSLGCPNLLHKSLERVQPPRFLNACRQMKLENESILYSEIMVFEEFDNILHTWKILKPYQLGSLFNTRKLGLPLLRTHYVCDWHSETVRETIKQDWRDERHSLMHLRKGMVRFAQELGLEVLEWSLGPSHLIDIGLEPSHLIDVGVERLAFPERRTVIARGLQHLEEALI
ncbi:hypothetical protein CKM354_000986800 [Cercospora kikuchii]|uniref:Uncharacterized protein n=1 Tax=Cercospora kikuchii TaxID=84275 RepID=A0A9P3FKL3_9PEZI|nr:uncharacterized protein CKM354_000986800 [Cercospora kikuchii]GIZ46755.1 hypothetical protein CKM354_000986800 [Cercospora kikuchii]